MKTRSVYALSLFISMVFLPACATTSLEEVRKNIVPRASFEMNCPQEKLNFVVLARLPNSGEISQVGVDGCDHRSVYVMNIHGQFVVNTTTAEAPIGPKKN